MDDAQQMSKDKYLTVEQCRVLMAVEFVEKVEIAAFQLHDLTGTDVETCRDLIRDHLAGIPTGMKCFMATGKLPLAPD